MKINIEYKGKKYVFLEVIDKNELLERVEKQCALNNLVLEDLGLTAKQELEEEMQLTLKPRETQYIQGETYITNPPEEKKQQPKSHVKKLIREYYLSLKSETEATVFKKELKENPILVNRLVLADFNEKGNIKQKELMLLLLSLELQELSISSYHLNTKALTVFLSESKTLRKISIKYHGGPREFTICLAAIAKNASLTHLKINFFSISEFCVGPSLGYIKALADVINQCPLEKLEINGAGISDKSIKILAEQITDNYTLCDLNLFKNRISLNHSSFADLLQKLHALTTLDLSRNRIGTLGLNNLGMMLTKMITLLINLNLSSNCIDSAEALKKFIAICTLRTLDVSKQIYGVDYLGYQQSYSETDLLASLFDFNGSIISFGKTKIARNQELIPILADQSFPTDHYLNGSKQVIVAILPAVLTAIVLQYLDDTSSAKIANDFVITFKYFLCMTGCKRWEKSKEKNQYSLIADNKVNAKKAVLNLREFLDKNNITEVSTVLVDNKLNINIPVEKILKIHTSLFTEEKISSKMRFFYEKQPFSQCDNISDSGCIIS